MLPRYSDESYLSSIRQLPHEANRLRLIRVVYAVLFFPAPLMAFVMLFLDIGSQEPTADWRWPLASLMAGVIAIALGARVWALRAPTEVRLIVMAAIAVLMLGSALFVGLLLSLLGASWSPFLAAWLVGYAVLVVLGPTRANVRRLLPTP
jgi:hypothetical protein